MAADPIRDFDAVRIEISRGYQESENVWSPVSFLRCLRASEGCGPIVGEAEFTQDYGEIQQIGASQFGQVNPSPDIGSLAGRTLCGMFVRLVRDSDDTAFWYGVIDSYQRAPAGGNEGACVWKASGLASILEQIVIRDGLVSSYTGIDAAAPGFMPPFNTIKGGDRSANPIGPDSSYVHDLSTKTSGFKWNAGQVLVHLLKVHGAYLGYLWTLQDSDGCLDYEPEPLDLDGQTLLAALNTLASPRRGITWRLVVQGASVYVVVESGSPTEISVGTINLPAATRTFSVDVSDDPAISSVAITRDETATYDIIELRGEHPIVGITLSFSSPTYAGASLLGLGFGWKTAAQTLWDSTPEHDAVGAEHVWRRFEIRSDWNGQQYNASNGLRDTATLSAAGDAAYGWGGYTGARSHDGGVSGPIPPIFMDETERHLPCAIGFISDRISPRQKPVVVFYFSGPTYEDRSLHHDVSIEEHPPAATLDDGHRGELNQEDLDGTSATLLVTMAFREVLPLRVSWVRDPSTWPRYVPRVKLIHIPNIEQWLVLDGSIKGVDPTTGAIQTQSGDLTVRDDIDRLRGLLALARGFYGQAAINATWTDRGKLDIDSAKAPGALLTGVTHGDVATVVNSIVVRREWRLVTDGDVERWDTTYVAERLRIDVEAIK